MKNLSILLLALVLFSCNEKQAKPMDADDIINKAIKVSGVDKLDSSLVAFDFRDKHYVANRNGGKFELQRQFTDSIGMIHDYLKNKGFERYVNDSLITLPDSIATTYSASVNSVHYFSVLPFGLDGNALKRTYLGDNEIREKNYHKIEVTFSQDGGGEDFEDIFIYWVNTETLKIDYLAYSYIEDDGIGLRFREAYNERYIKGIRFVDYNNYKPNNKNSVLKDMDNLYIENKLELLSKIELENVTVN